MRVIGDRPRSGRSEVAAANLSRSPAEAAATGGAACAATGTRPCRPPTAGRVDLIVANPPYVAEHEWPGLDPVVRDFDPLEALVAGPSGLEAIETIVAGAPDWLAEPERSSSRSRRTRRAGRSSWRASAGFATAVVEDDLAGPATGARGAAVSRVRARRARRGVAAGQRRGRPDRHRLRAGRRSPPCRARSAACSLLKRRPEHVALPVLIADPTRARGPGGARPAAADAPRGALLAGPAHHRPAAAARVAFELGGDPATIGLRCPANPLVRGAAAPDRTARRHERQPPRRDALAQRRRGPRALRSRREPGARRWSLRRGAVDGGLARRSGPCVPAGRGPRLRRDRRRCQQGCAPSRSSRLAA